MGKLLLFMLLLAGSQPSYSQTIEDDLKEVGSKFYFRGHPINPWVVNAFNSFVDGPIIMSLDLIAASNSNRYNDSSKIKSTQGFSPRDEGYFSYKYEGKTENGMSVVTSNNVGLGASRGYTSIYFFSFKIRKGFDDDGTKYGQLLMILEKRYTGHGGSYPLITINKNTVTIDEPPNVQDNPKAKHLIRKVLFD